MASNSTEEPTTQHVVDTLRSVAKLRADHARSTAPLQRLTDTIIGVLGRPTVAVWLTIAVVFWMGVNGTIAASGGTPLDPPPFFWLEGTVSLAALYLVIFILASQRHENALAERRELLALEIAVLSEQKNAKIIQLLEEFRRDSPQLFNRVDLEAEKMSVPADPTTVAAAISASQALGDSLPSAPSEASA